MQIMAIFYSIIYIQYGAYTHHIIIGHSCVEYKEEVFVMIVYDRLWITLKKKNISQYALIKDYGIHAPVAEFRRGAREGAGAVIKLQSPTKATGPLFFPPVCNSFPLRETLSAGTGNVLPVIDLPATCCATRS